MECEDRVLDAKIIAVYRGRLVLKIGGFKGRSFSFGFMFLSPKLKAGDEFARDMVRHEYGHTVQLKQMGLAAYIKKIAIPSVKSKVKGPEYYEQKWEVTADVDGGVVTRVHDELNVQAARDYVKPVKGRHG